MLNPCALEATLSIDARLAERGEQLSVISGTPMGSLLDACWVNMPNGISGEPFMFMKNSTYTPEGGVCEHDATMDEICAEVGPAVLRNINWARTVVAPAIQELHDFIVAFATEEQTRDPSALEIVTDEWADVWSNPTLAQMVSQYEGLPADPILPKIPAISGIADDEAAATLMRTGISHVDEQIGSLLASQDPGLAAYTINSYLGSNVDGNSSIAELNTVGPGNATTALKLFLAARNLADNRPAEVKMDDAAYGEDMAKIVNYLGSRVSTALKDRNTAMDIRRLRASYPDGSAGSSKIFVDGDVYRKFLEDGGSPEILFGAALTDQNSDYSTLLSNKEKYLGDWTAKRGWHAAQVEANKADIIRQAAAKGLYQLAANVPEELRVVDVATLGPAIDAVASAIGQADIECLYTLARELVCRVLYPHTDAGKILKLFDEAKQADASMTNEEACLIVVVDLLSDWVCTQITITKV